MEFRSSAGLRISVGKNNSQNDQLTTKLAYKSDIWLHTQKIHGSHVILWTEGRAPDLQSLNEAACLAAWFSQARGASRVPVDHTPIKYVKAQRGLPRHGDPTPPMRPPRVTPDESVSKSSTPMTSSPPACALGRSAGLSACSVSSLPHL
ncbi:MAG: NFACT RNA binding domain-containing protein [Lawsonibacter sp.]